MYPTEFDLTVQVSAADWAYNKRRTVYLEAMLIRLLRDEDQLEEWLSAEDLASLRLPGLAISAASISRKASAKRWLRRRSNGARGHRYLYHVSSLPARAFDALIARLLDLPNIESDPLAPPVPQPEPAAVSLMAPPWVLPLMRLMKAGDDLATAWRDLPAALPPGVELPTVEEAATVLVRFGLAN